MSNPQLNKESVVNNSIKKFFVDYFVNGEGVHVVFDRTMSPPRQNDIDRWLFVEMHETVPGHLNRKLVYIHCFSKNDMEGVELDNLIDIVMDYLWEGRMLFYANDLVTQIGAARLALNDISRLIVTKDQTKMKYLPITLTWGGVW